MKILANDGISEDGLMQLNSYGYEVSTNHTPHSELAARINEGGYEILLVRSATIVSSDIIDACPKLRMIGRGGVGMDNIDVNYARQKGIEVINTPNASSESVAELVIAQMFAISRSLHESSASMKDGDFKSLKKKFSKGTELRGKTLGIVGFGRIGRALATYALGIGMHVVAVDIEEGEAELSVYLNHTEYKLNVNIYNNIEDILPYCDFISLHIPTQPNGDAAITSKHIELMQDGVVIINAARGGVIDETDLINALNSGKISAAALDVFENEPNPKKELLSHSRIFCTPHIGAGTVEAQDRIGMEIANAIVHRFGDKS
jgi:D-3-phosphoglycerate dehydrogenase